MLTKPEDVVSLFSKGIISWPGMVHIPFINRCSSLLHISNLSLKKLVVLLFTLNKKMPKKIDKCITLCFVSMLIIFSITQYFLYLIKFCCKDLRCRMRLDLKAVAI